MAVPGTREGALRVADGFAAFALDHGLPASVARAFQVALDEMLSNTVRHGYAARGGPPGSIEALFSLADGVMAVTITDDAPAFDPLEAPPPELRGGLAERPIGGLGIHLVRQLMDAVDYGFEDGRNRIVLSKRIA